ncbi:TetR/AcrR family transcriptional regulator [Erythrobacter insulae]|uniref:TetR/AcrR family transcriptional regulator n=1 Tax=Erythrobacter insulae TaxID=2584124 RepID=A0A547P9U1_9SPHN|nr:TetR/AcrR family transcriptional regulator [Erythrobacter insulae]TRD10921.1 TetR/AcrR family transcriptional regulator [Erythrobacter insulae]
MNDRLKKSHWIKHGLKTLASAGESALKVGTMSSQLNVSRGSFYWHFQDAADFRSQLLQSWQESTTTQVIQNLAEKAERSRLKYLMRRAFVGDRSLDRAIRSWAMHDDEVAKVVEAVDTERVQYIAKLLAKAGVEDQLALDRAAFIYWAYLGQEIVVGSRHSSIRVSVLDEISELLES